MSLASKKTLSRGSFDIGSDTRGDPARPHLGWFSPGRSTSCITINLAGLPAGPRLGECKAVSKGKLSLGFAKACNCQLTITTLHHVAQPIIGAKTASHSPKKPVNSSTSTPAAVQRLTIDEGGAGQRLDNFLIKVLKGAPKTLVYRIIRSGEVRVNKGRASADTRLSLGDEVRVPPLRLSK